MSEKVIQYSQLQKDNSFANNTFRKLQKQPSITLSENSSARFSLPKTSFDPIH
jgi:hypothetical protein